MTQYNLFTPPEIQLGRDAVQQQKQAGENDVRIFNAQMKVESQKKSTLANMLDGLQDGLNLAQATQTIQSNELKIRQQKLQLEKTEMLDQFELKRTRDDEAFIAQLKTASSAEQVAILDRADPAVLNRNRDVAMIALRGIENDVDAPPALREIVTNELIPKIDPSRQEAELKEQRLQARDERDFQQKRQLQNERLAAQERRDKQRRRDEMREASRKRRSEIIERRNKAEQQAATKVMTARDALNADPILQQQAKQAGVATPTQMIQGATLKKVTDSKVARAAGVDTGEFVYEVTNPDNSKSYVPVTSTLRKQLTQARIAKQEAVQQTAQAEVQEQGTNQQNTQRKVEASAKASYEAIYGPGSWENAEEETRNKVRNQVRAQIGS